MSGANNVRFCGKIYGTCFDYWVVNGVHNVEEVKGLPEPRGKGVNELTWWVCGNLVDDWVQLPDCMPVHVKAARKVKTLLTGHLNADVKTNPPFPGQERHLLRAQLARIFHATALHPKGMLNMEAINEDEGAPEVMKVVDDFPFPQTDDLKQLEAWGNTYPQIMNEGNTTHIAPANVDDDGEWKAAQEEKEPTVERFRVISEHKGLPGTG